MSGRRGRPLDRGRTRRKARTKTARALCDLRQAGRSRAIFAADQTLAITVDNKILKVTEHRRDFAGLKYIYPVISRRAGGVSVGINLNTNNACNWRCIYCQVPDLKLGTAPPVDLVLLENELRGFLDELLHGDFMLTRVPEGARRLNDIALSGNGEPTSAAEFMQVIELLGKL